MENTHRFNSIKLNLDNLSVPEITNLVDFTENRRHRAAAELEILNAYLYPPVKECDCPPDQVA